eukprot:COSAG02_NODE_1827_length_10743_cov_19.183859_7_plen_97_part_00
MLNPGIHVCIYEYIVFSSSSSLSHSFVAQHCIACATTLSSNNTHANAHPVGSMSHGDDDGPVDTDTYLASRTVDGAGIVIAFNSNGSDENGGRSAA